MDALVLLGSLALLLAIGVPVAYSLGIASLLGALWLGIPLEGVMIKISGGVSTFALLAIPFFVLAGAIMAEGGMANRLVSFAYILVGFIRGGLSLVNILASTFFGAISGSSIADTASIGSVLIPEMEKKGYPRDFATAVTCCGSVQALLIPPSHNAVIYSLAAGGSVSIGALFLGGVAPGLLLGATLAIMCLCFAHKRNYPKGEFIPLKQALKITLDAFWGLMTMVIILGGILSGVFTATESASIAVVWAFLVTMFIYHDYKWKDLPRLIHRTVKTVSVVMILIALASAFGYILTMMQLPHKITLFFTGLSGNKYIIMLLINAMMLLLGCLMDLAPLILILTPILLPLVKSIGIDPVHFGLIMLVNLGMGLITPPVGAVLFVGAAVSGLKMEQVVRTTLPFLGGLFLVLMAITYLPSITLLIPWLSGLVTDQQICAATSFFGCP
jgi:tripartite ATP-independent transporter DctM subunit